LPPPATLLAHLVEREPAEVLGDDLRSRLLGGDPQARAAAIKVLEDRSPDSLEKGWAILEGPTSVDAYLETTDLIVVVEGKRTESGPTTQTTFMPVRHQMLRAIDAAWDVRGARDVVGFFIVGRDSVSYARTTLDPSAITASLPHRSLDERERIARAFLGVTTWDDVCAEFDIDVRALPDTIAINGAL
jgi:hypothetical protein